MEVLTVRGLVLFLAVVHPALGLIFPQYCFSGEKIYMVGETWVQDCRQCQCYPRPIGLPFPVCGNMSNTTSCSLHGTTTTMAVSASASAEPTTTATTTVPSTTTTTMTTTTIQTPTGDTVPVITFVSPNVTVSKGDNFNLSCNASGVPPPVITWGFVDFSGFPEILHNGVIVDGGNLHVTAATNQHAGTFVCRARNGAGHADARIYVTVFY